MKIYLDDERPAPEGYKLIKSGEDFVHFMRWLIDRELRATYKGFIDELTLISLDHDLGAGWMDGTSVMNWIKNVVQQTIWSPPPIVFHTANPVGRARMDQVYWDILKIVDMRSPNGDDL